jgi:putative membrane protein
MRIHSLLLLVTAAGAATMVGCNNNNHRDPVSYAEHGQTIEGTDPNAVRYAPLNVYIAPGETPPYGTMRFRPVGDETYERHSMNNQNGTYTETKTTVTRVEPGVYAPGTAPETTTTTSGNTSTTTTVASGPATTPDSKALAFLHHKNNEEIQAGMLASQKGSSPAVREYGEMLARDHRAADDKVSASAKAQGVLVMSNEKPHEDPLAKLRTLEGSDFDKAFAKEMISGHEKVISKLEKMRAEVTNSSTRQLIDDTLPTLRTHLEKARQLPQ